MLYYGSQVKLATLESALEEWKSAARTHGVDSARSLSSALDSALNSQLNATAASSQAQSQLAQLTEVCLILQKKTLLFFLKVQNPKSNSSLNQRVCM